MTHKEALTALVHEMEYVLSCINANKVPFDGDDFHEALRLGKEALAQQCVCGEPDSAGTHRTDGPCLAPQPEQCRKEQRGNGEYVCNCKSGECPELAQPEQESDDLTIAYMAGLSRGKDLAPQRTWVGLTNDEMHQLNDALNLNGRFPIIAAIEAKLKEKNT